MGTGGGGAGGSQFSRRTHGLPGASVANTFSRPLPLPSHDALPTLYHTFYAIDGFDSGERKARELVSCHGLILYTLYFTAFILYT